MGTVVMGTVVIAALGVTACSADGPPAALPKATCGGAVTHALNAGTQVLSADKGSLNCFDSAMRHCRAASIAITEMGVDTGTDYVFEIAPGGAGCPVTELSQSYSANFGGSTGAVTSAQCRLAGMTSAGSELSCAGGDVLIPSAAAQA
jgi:hypothetical protein